MNPALGYEIALAKLKSCVPALALAQAHIESPAGEHLPVYGAGAPPPESPRLMTSRSALVTAIVALAPGLMWMTRLLITSAAPVPRSPHTSEVDGVGDLEPIVSNGIGQVGHIEHELVRVAVVKAILERALEIRRVQDTPRVAPPQEYGRVGGHRRDELAAFLQAHDRPRLGRLDRVAVEDQLHHVVGPGERLRIDARLDVREDCAIGLRHGAEVEALCSGRVDAKLLGDDGDVLGEGRELDGEKCAGEE